MSRIPIRPRGAPVFVAFLLGVTALPPTSAAAAAPPVNCGDTITISVTLTTDLHCATDGLTIGADGVRVNLNRHTIYGAGMGIGIASAEYRDLTISNGTITGFRAGIALEHTTSTVVREVRLLHNDASAAARPRGGIMADQVSGLRIQGGRIIDAARAAGVEASSGIVLSGVEVTGSVDIAIDTPGSRLSNNTFRNGELVLSEANDTVLWGNSFLRSYLSISECTDVSLLDNQLTATMVRIGVSEDVLVQNNSIRAAEVGLAIRDPATDVRVLNNVFSGNGHGLRVDATTFAAIGGLTVSNNTFSLNGSAGLFIEARAGSSGDRVTVAGNLFVGNGYLGRTNDVAGRRVDDGLHTNVLVGSPLVVARNRTRDDADFGIEALPEGSVRDGGGNVSDNDRSGCAGVACR